MPKTLSHLRDCGVYEPPKIPVTTDNPNLVYASDSLLNERTVQSKLKEMLGGVAEKKINVCGVIFLIDLLTDNQLIEIKRYDRYKIFNAIGQVLTYGAFYPNHEKVIHLLGIIRKQELEMFEQICKLNNITLKWNFTSGIGGYVI